MNTPLRFEPYLRPMVWGGRQLAEVLGRALPESGPYGEAWEISDHASHSSVVADGPYRGRTLRSLMEQHREALLGPAAERHRIFPWLIKLLDAWDWLSVQVHPSEKDVVHLWPGECSKTEAWFILAAAPGSRIWAGLLPGVEERHLKAALAEGDVARCLHPLEPRPGDCLYLPAGTVHAVGGGVLMAEVQQTSDATFRLFDWNRQDAQGQRRRLHIEEALACIDWKQGPVHPVRARGYPLGDQSGDGPVRQQLVHCPYFVLEYVRQNRRFGGQVERRLQVLLVLHGQGRLDSPGGSCMLRRGDCLLLPAALESWECCPQEELGLLLSTLPDPR